MEVVVRHQRAWLEPEPLSAANRSPRQHRVALEYLARESAKRGEGRPRDEKVDGGAHVGESGRSAGQPGAELAQVHPRIEPAPTEAGDGADHDGASLVMGSDQPLEPV